MSDFPTYLPGEIVTRFGHAFDLEGRIPHALDALAPIADRDILLLDTPVDGLRATQLRALDGRIVAAPPDPAGSALADVVIALWSTLDEPGSASERAAMRLARPGGRVLAIHDYGRDEVHPFIATQGVPSPSGSPEGREAPFLAGGWKIRVIHCYWTFGDLEQARGFAASFGEPGRVVAAAMRRPRLSHNVAVFYRSAAASP